MDLDRSFVRVALLADGVEVARWRLCVRPHDELRVADVLARTCLAAHRKGLTVALDRTDPVLGQFLQLLGLGLVRREDRLVVEVLGKAEDREQRGVDEVVMTDDPVP